MKALGVSRGITLLFLGPQHARWGCGGQPTPWPSLPPGKTRYPFYRRLGGPQGWSGRAENFVPARIRSWTVQPVVSHYTDWATRPTSLMFIMFVKTLTDLTITDSYCMFHFTLPATTNLTQLDGPQKWLTAPQLMFSDTNHNLAALREDCTCCSAFWW